MFMLGVEIEIEIDSVIGAVTGLSEGIPLKREAVLRATPLYNVALKRFGTFLQVKVNVPGAGEQLLVGTKAIDYHIETQGHKLSTGAIHDIDGKALKLLRVHDWLLTDAQRDVREDIVKAMTSNALAPLKSLTAPLAVGAEAPRSSAEGASSGPSEEHCCNDAVCRDDKVLSFNVQKAPANASEVQGRWKEV